MCPGFTLIFSLWTGENHYVKRVNLVGRYAVRSEANSPNPVV
jgi:hypothetical protein